MTAFMVPRTTGVESKYIYGLMGVRAAAPAGSCSRT